MLLIVEDDPHYSRIIMDLAHDEGLKVLIAARGAEALALAREFRPLAISLDVFLPDMLGWAVLSQLKQDSQTRHIPVQIITLDDDRQHGLAGGAFSFVNKPTTMDKLKRSIARLTEYARTPKKRLLVVEDNPSELIGITELLNHNDIDLVTAETGREALAMLRDRPSDCIVLDLRLPDMSGFELLEQISRDDALAQVPVVVFTGRELSPEEDAQTACDGSQRRGEGRRNRRSDFWMKRPSSSIGWSPNRAPRQTTYVGSLRNSDENLLAARRSLSMMMRGTSSRLSSVLERRGMDVLTATTGREAISVLEADRGISIVLMDIMMPEMDGYETMQAIRRTSLRRLPIIALTAKAMKGDREKCLEAGASDYLAKPVTRSNCFRRFACGCIGSWGGHAARGGSGQYPARGRSAGEACSATK